MIYKSIFYSILCASVSQSAHLGLNDWRERPQEAKCLTGYMTDVQTWVDREGKLIMSPERPGFLDLSAKYDLVGALQNEISVFKCSETQMIKYLSMAKCSLSHVPPIFQTADRFGRSLAETAEYITFYGNDFAMIPGDSVHYDIMMNASHAREITTDDEFQRIRMSGWAFGFQDLTFLRLRELDLRACSIKVIGDSNFRGMPQLEKLYLSENNLYYIHANAFTTVRRLKHLDLSRNSYVDENNIRKRLEFEAIDIFKRVRLESLDLSFTLINLRSLLALRHLGRNLQRLSLCYTSSGQLPNDILNGTSIRYLDVSGNNKALLSQFVLRGLEDTLQVLYAENISLKNLHILKNMTNLEILKLKQNEIVSIDKKDLYKLKNLQVLDLDNNRLTAWFKPFVKFLPKLKMLSLQSNNINLISEEMFEDMQNLSYLSLFGNFMVCNCHVRDLYDVALKNEFLLKDIQINEINKTENTWFHTGYLDYNTKIRERINVSDSCVNRGSCMTEFNSAIGHYLFLDYDKMHYQCLSLPDHDTVNFFHVQSCSQMSRETNINEAVQDGWNKLLILLILPAVMFPILAFLCTFRKNFKYFLITMRNSAMLSLISKSYLRDEDTIYNYDVFVSYCNEDRAWVLDHLLPHVEIDCNISVCLHERDFQVGLSILENIVSCMDRSRMIMLILSKQFLLSQWCQFEMHLAQHRLLETRREDLILILLEDIPRRLRPNTLHYLMVTKTYIVWPKEESNKSLFWRRLKKCLVTNKLKQTENVSLA